LSDTFASQNGLKQGALLPFILKETTQKTYAQVGGYY